MTDQSPEEIRADRAEDAQYKLKEQLKMAVGAIEETFTDKKLSSNPKLLGQCVVAMAINSAAMELGGFLDKIEDQVADVAHEICHHD